MGKNQIKKNGQKSATSTKQNPKEHFDKQRHSKAQKCSGKKKAHNQSSLFRLPKQPQKVGGNNSSSSGGNDSSSKLSTLQQSFARKLEGARFRHINEQLYTSSGDAAFSDFQSDPTLFDAYHSGFREQCAQWPYNPLDGIIDWLKSSSGSINSNAVVADLGCGDARLAASVPQKVHSFDLVSRNPAVVACDIAHVPLADSSVDVAVFCLALMGTNCSEFIKEAHRILRVGGVMRIAEVRSRFEGEPEGLKKFMRFLKKAGFDLSPRPSSSNSSGSSSSGNKKPVPLDAAATTNKMFFELEATKSVRPANFDDGFSVKACVYKKR